MVLYQSDDVHFDLLVKNDSRIALLGLLAGEEAGKDNLIKIKDNQTTDDGWHNVKLRKNKMKKPFDNPASIDILDDNNDETNEVIR